MTIIIALIFAHMVTRAWDEARAQSAEARQRAADRREEARQRRQEARERRDEARAARAERLDHARQYGPSDPLWWVWAAGWTVAATVSGAGAAAVGARDGARIGARQGYRIGKERAAARAARKRAEHDAYQRGRTDGATATGERQAEDAVTVEPCPICGALLPNPAACTCTRRRARRGTPRPGPSTGPAADRADEVVDGEVVDDPPHQTRAADEPEIVDAEVVDDPNTRTTEIERTGEMAQITSGMSGGDGEGYGSTVTSLTEIKTLLQQVSEIVNDLGDTLVSRQVDAETTGGVSELDDHLQAAVTVLEQTLRHAQDRHEPVAAAIAGAGGSTQIAQTDWYDDL